MKVRIRDDIRESGEIPGTDTGFIPVDMVCRVFEAMQPEWATNSEFNMLITTETSTGTYMAWVNSIDFEFLPDDGIPDALVTSLMKEVASLRELIDKLRGITKSALHIESLEEGVKPTRVVAAELCMCRFETPSFSFNAFGASEQAAQYNLKVAWAKHATETGASVDYLNEYMDDVDVIKHITADKYYRDWDDNLMTYCPKGGLVL